jgi:hypothetical protein
LVNDGEGGFIVVVRPKEVTVYHYRYGNWQNYNTGNAILTHQNNTGMVSLPITIPVMQSPHLLPLPVR